MIIRGGSLLFPPPRITPVTFSVQAMGLADQASNPFTFNHNAADADSAIVDVVTTSSNAMTGVTYAGTPMRCKGINRLTGNSWQMKYALPNVAAGANTVSCNGVSAWAAGECISYQNAGKFGLPRRARGTGTAMSHAVVPPANGMVQECLYGVQSMSSLAGGNARSYRNGSSTDVAIRDASANATMTGTLASSSNWGGMCMPVYGTDYTGPYFNTVWGMGAAAISTDLSFTLPGVEAGEDVAVDVVLDRAGTSISWVTVGGEDTFLLKSQTFTGISGLGTHYRYVMTASTSGDKTIAIKASNASAWINACAVSVGNYANAGTTISGSGSSSVPSKAVTPLTNGFSIISFAMANGGSLPTVNGTFLWDSWMNNNCSIYMYLVDRAETVALSSSTNWSYIETPLN